MIPRDSKTSSVRGFTTVARSHRSGAGCASTIRHSIPRRWSSEARSSPVGPAPTTRTLTSATTLTVVDRVHALGADVSDAGETLVDRAQTAAQDPALQALGGPTIGLNHRDLLSLSLAAPGSASLVERHSHSRRSILGRRTPAPDRRTPLGRGRGPRVPDDQRQASPRRIDARLRPRRWSTARCP